MKRVYRKKVDSQLDDARRIGALAAYRIRTKLGLLPTDRVDIFRLISEAGVLLRFASLDGLYGSYQRIGGMAGILINAGHPLNLQRLTAAHEYGHHILNHWLSMDEEPGIEGKPSTDLHEQEAFAFAANLMIPLDGIYALLPSGGRRNLPLKSHEVYRISTEFGVSYRAVIVQLVAQGIISFRQAENLKKASPLAIKRLIGMGWEPHSARISVRAFGRSDSGRVVFVDRGDEIHVYLPVDSVGKLEWQDKVHTESLERLGTSFICSEAGKPFQRFVWRAVKAGVVDLCCARSEAEEEGQFNITIHVLRDLRPEKEGLYGVNELVSGSAA